MPSVSVPAAIVGSSVVGGVVSSQAAKSAASEQAQAASAAAAQQQAMFGQIQQNTAPYTQLGNQATDALGTELGLGGYENNSQAAGVVRGSLTAPFQPTMAQLQQTPGYQFTLQQGLEAAQNGYAAQGLGSSGAAIKGAANYAEGLAGTTYQNQFNNYLAQNQQNYNLLSGAVNIGQNANALVANAGQQTTNQSTNDLMSSAAASAAGTVGSANAITGAVNSIGSAALTGYGINFLQNNGMYGASRTPANNTYNYYGSSSGGP